VPLLLQLFHLCLLLQRLQLRLQPIVKPLFLLREDMQLVTYCDPPCTLLQEAFHVELASIWHWRHALLR
jgi:hypothetical protein